MQFKYDVQISVQPGAKLNACDEFKSPKVEIAKKLENWGLDDVKLILIVFFGLDVGFDVCHLVRKMANICLLAIVVYRQPS